MTKLIARRGRSWNLLLTNEEERLGRVYNSADDELFEEHFFDSDGVLVTATDFTPLLRRPSETDLLDAPPRRVEGKP